jgi:hypothetical protein
MQDDIFGHIKRKRRDAERHIGCGWTIAVSGQGTEPLD